MNVLPDCRPKVQRKVVRLGSSNWTPIYCANCGNDGGMVPADNHDFAFYLCIPCSEKLGNIDGIYMEPDAEFWDRILAEQINQYGRILTPDEQFELLKEDNTLSKLAKDKPVFGA